MELTTLTISVPKDVEAILEKRARDKGQDVVEYVEICIIEQARRPTLRELFAPVREQIQASGISDGELNELLESARIEAHQERERKKRGER
jgi:hypothetical protein